MVGATGGVAETGVVADLKGCRLIRDRGITVERVAHAQSPGERLVGAQVSLTSNVVWLATWFEGSRSVRPLWYWLTLPAPHARHFEFTFAAICQRKIGVLPVTTALP